MGNLREASKINYESNYSLEAINTGSLQRIADATEKMASNYQNMEAQLDYFKRNCKSQQETINRLYKSNSALRGWIKRLKKK